jgi:hypothetical protein
MASLITARLVPLLREHFSPNVVRIAPEQVPFAVFPAVHSDVGNIELYDDGDELTISLGHFTHRHLGNYDEGLSDGQKADLIAAECVKFLDDIFADRVEFFGSHTGGGGCGLRTDGPRGFFSRSLYGKKSFVWSGPLQNAE